MKYSKVRISKENSQLKGLNEIDLTKKTLGSVVALVGQNGAGKSRILGLIEKYINLIAPEDFINKHITGIEDQFKMELPALANNFNAMYSSYSAANLDKLDDSDRNANLTNATNQAKHIINEIKSIANSYIKVVNSDDIKKMKKGLPNNLQFSTIIKNEHHKPILTSNDSSSRLNEFNDLSTEDFFEFLNRHTDDIINDDFDLYHEYADTEEFKSNPHIIKNKLKQKESFIVFEKFNKYLQDFLGKKFAYKNIRNGQGKSQLFFDNIPFKFESLSPGQRTLLAYAILFFYMDMNSKTNLNECIIIIDEPELHLHPLAQIHLINTLRKLVNEKGQLWIATHSVHILSHLESDEIFLVKDGSITTPKSTTPGEALTELMGFDCVEELETFINSRSEWAYANFMIQCFKDPDVISEINTEDPQYRLFKLFKDFIVGQPTLSLLDFGAGKGRLGYTIQEDPELKDKIKYTVVELEKSFHPILKKIKNINGVFPSTNNITGESFDMVLLCNVLHEISPDKWLNLFAEIKRILKKEGYLIIIEDKNLPKGECANDYGYLILNGNSIKKLLSTDVLLEKELENPIYKNRFTFCAVKKEDINSDTETLLSSLKSLNKDLYAEIKEIKKDWKNAANGRLYANKAQLYINSTLAIEKLELISILVGRWDKIWAKESPNGHEISEITKDFKYFVGDEEWFLLEYINVNSHDKTISFCKRAVKNDDTRILYDELKILENGDLVGDETLYFSPDMSKPHSKYSISYSKVLS